MDNLNLSTLFRTKGEMDEFLKHLSEVSSKIYKMDFDLDKILLDEFGIKLKEALVDLLKENNVSAEKPNELKQFFENIKETANSLPTLGLTLAFEPKESTLKQISDWFALNLKQQVIFDIKVNHSLIAGASISFKGKIVENSIQHQVIKILEEHFNNTHKKEVKDKSETGQTLSQNMSV